MGETINVCIVSPDFLPIWSGIGSYTVELIKHLPENIHIHLVTLRRTIRSGKKSIELDDNSISSKLNKNLHIHYISEAKDTFLYHLNFQIACLRKIPQLHKQYQFDLLHSHFPLMSDVLLQLLKKNQIPPTISTVHTTIEGQHLGVEMARSFDRSIKLSELDRSEKANLLLYMPLKVYESLFLRNVHRLIAVSKFVKKELVNYLGVAEKRIGVIHNGVDTKTFSPKRLSKIPGEAARYLDIGSRPVILYTGRLTLAKGISVLIDAVPEVIKSVPDAYFVFSGGGNYEPYFRWLRRRGVHEKNALFLGYVKDYFDMPALYALATIYVAPTFYDSLPLRVLEAMSCGKAVVASNVGGIPEIIQNWHNGIIIPPGNSKVLAEKLTFLLENEKFSAMLGTRARKTILSNFSAERMALDTAEVYRKEVTNTHRLQM
ncbi:MAG: glycosyltransferase family 4 protein [Candidatus Bathyarchaeota archaeon]|nr:glycosyltransferase family 4 protein [Candidatus Bathyarchaeota archaeon]